MFVSAMDPYNEGMMTDVLRVVSAVCLVANGYVWNDSRSIFFYFAILCTVCVSINGSYVVYLDCHIAQAVMLLGFKSYVEFVDTNIWLLLILKFCNFISCFLDFLAMTEC